MPGADATPVFVIDPIEDLVPGIFNAPVIAIRAKDVGGTGVQCTLPGDARDDFTGLVNIFLITSRLIAKA
jgi:hypothetical protein